MQVGFQKKHTYRARYTTLIKSAPTNRSHISPLFQKLR